MKVWVWKKSNKNECKRCSSSNWGGRVSLSLRVICFREWGIRYHQIWLSCFYPLQALRRAFCRPVPARTIENFPSQFRVRTYPFAPPLGGSLPLSESFALIAQSGSYLTFTDNFMDQALARDIFDYVSAGSFLPACLPASATSSELEPCKARLKLAKVQTAGKKKSIIHHSYILLEPREVEKISAYSQKKVKKKISEIIGSTRGCARTDKQSRLAPTDSAVSFPLIFFSKSTNNPGCSDPYHDKAVPCLDLAIRMR